MRDTLYLTMGLFFLFYLSRWINILVWLMSLTCFKHSIHLDHNLYIYGTLFFSLTWTSSLSRVLLVPSFEDLAFVSSTFIRIFTCYDFNFRLCILTFKLLSWCILLFFMYSSISLCITIEVRWNVSCFLHVKFSSNILRWIFL